MNRRKEMTADAAGSGMDNSAPLVLPMGGPAHSRNYGIDFLRCLSMFFVVLLHVLKWGGGRQSGQQHPGNSQLRRFMVS